MPGKWRQCCEECHKPQWVVKEDMMGNPRKSCQALQHNYRSSIFNVSSIFSISTDRDILTLQLLPQLVPNKQESDLLPSIKTWKKSTKMCFDCLSHAVSIGWCWIEMKEGSVLNVSTSLTALFSANKIFWCVVVYFILGESASLICLLGPLLVFSYFTQNATPGRLTVFKHGKHNITFPATFMEVCLCISVTHSAALHEESKSCDNALGY